MIRMLTTFKDSQAYRYNGFSRHLFEAVHGIGQSICAAGNVAVSHEYASKKYDRPWQMVSGT